MTLQIRAEQDGDQAAVAALLREAFAGERVDMMVAALRTAPGYLPGLALVAVEPVGDVGETVVGFVMLTTIHLETPSSADGGRRLVEMLCLSPLAVATGRQRAGIGSALVSRALELAWEFAAERGDPYVALEGDPAYYRRFGFVPSDELGVRSPSERIPHGCFQLFPLQRNESGVPGPTGRALYSETFWTVATPGLPFEGVTWLDELERHCRLLEATVAGPGVDTAAVLTTAVPACPGWTVADVLHHLGIVEHLVDAWLRDGRRPRSVQTQAPAGDVVRWFADGWRALHDRLAAAPADSPAATWSPWEATNGFWRRKQVHEHAMHTLDVLQALGREREWPVSQQVALDGIDEVVRLWLGTCLGTDVRGRGDVVRLVALDASHPDGPAGDELWTVVLNPGNAELHRLPTAPDATVTADPVTLYRWLWGRTGNDEVAVVGDTGAVAVLRDALSRAMA